MMLAGLSCALSLMFISTRTTSIAVRPEVGRAYLVNSTASVTDLGPYDDGRRYEFTPEGRLISVSGDWRALSEISHGCNDYGYNTIVFASNGRQCVGMRTRSHATESAAGADISHVGARTEGPLAFVCRDNQSSDIIVSGQVSSCAYGINNEGLVVGSFSLVDGLETAFMWSDGYLENLDDRLEPGSPWHLIRAFDINDDGVVVGVGLKDEQLRIFLLEENSAAGASGPLTTGLLLGPFYPGPIVFGIPLLCESLGAEDGTFGSWNCLRASYGSGLQGTPCALGPNVIMTLGDAEYSGAPFPVVDQLGGTNSIRIGDNLSGGDVCMGCPGFVDAVETTFVVSSSEPILNYRYAVVFEDGGHPESQQPYFKVEVFVPSTAATPIDTLYKWADPADDFLHDFGTDLLYREWSCRRVDLSTYQGQTARIRAQVSDCQLGGHFGYAYLDVPCDPHFVSLNAPQCSGLPVIADGSNNSGVLNHFWSVQESDAFWNRYGVEAMQWFPGDPGTLNVADFFNGHGGVFQCGKFYRVGLALSTECESWVSTGRLVYANCVDAGPDVYVCPSSPTATLSVVNPIAGITYSWFTDSGTPLGSGTGTSINLSGPGIFGTYTLQAIEPHTGCIATDTVTVRPWSDFTVQITKCECGGATQLTASAVGTAVGVTTVVWTPGGQTGHTITVHPNVEGPTVYTATVTSPCYSRNGAIAVAGAPPVRLIAPNAFTPNNDGLNDTFVVLHLGIGPGQEPAYDADSMIMRLWDRWGGLAYEMQYDANACDAFDNGIIEWNGIANRSVNHRLPWRPDITSGQLVPLGVYTYKIWRRPCGGSYELTPVNDQWAPFVTVLP